MEIQIFSSVFVSNFSFAGLKKLKFAKFIDFQHFLRTLFLLVDFGSKNLKISHFLAFFVQFHRFRSYKRRFKRPKIICIHNSPQTNCLRSLRVFPTPPRTSHFSFFSSFSVAFVTLSVAPHHRRPHPPPSYTQKKKKSLPSAPQTNRRNGKRKKNQKSNRIRRSEWKVKVFRVVYLQCCVESEQRIPNDSKPPA